jgi:hypothetical protein
MGRRRGAGEGSIFRRSDGRWVASISLPPVGGKRQRRTVYGTTYEEARDTAREVRKLMDAGITPSAGVRLDHYLERWLTETVPRQVAAKTAHEYRRFVRPIARHTTARASDHRRLQRHLGCDAPTRTQP